MKTFNLYLFLIIITFSSICPACIDQQINTKEKAEKSAIEQYADSLFNSNVDSNIIAGASLIIFKKGKVLLNKKYGLSSIELQTPMPENALFEIGSVTKQFTSAAIMKLVESGKLNLNDDFTKYVDFDTQGKRVTINNLLYHTSGIASYTNLPEFWEIQKEDYEKDAIVKFIENAGFDFEPGQMMLYNNSGYFLLGLVIEKVSGQEYAEFLNRELFEPLGLKHTFYSSNTSIMEGKVYGYESGEEGLRQRSYLSHAWPYAAGSLCSSTGDLLKWLQGLHEGKVLSKDSYLKFITPNELLNGEKTKYGMGISNYMDNGYKVIGHGGAINGFVSETRFYQNEDLYIICLINTFGEKGVDEFVDNLIWQLLEKKETVYSAREKSLDELVGDYTSIDKNGMVTIRVNEIEGDLLVGFDVMEEMDTLTYYIGNNCWEKGTEKYFFKEDTLFFSDPYGVYVLVK